MTPPECCGFKMHQNPSKRVWECLACGSSLDDAKHLLGDQLLLLVSRAALRRDIARQRREEARQ